MEWLVEKDLPAYAERVLPWLEYDPVRNTVPATVLLARLDGVQDQGPPWLAWLRNGTGEVAAVALRTPPRSILVSALPPGAAASLAAAAEPGLPGAAGLAADVEAFVTAYADRRGAHATYARRSRLFRLTEVAHPPPLPGRLRPATEADVGLAATWFGDFTREAGLGDGSDPLPRVRRVVSRGRALFWEVDGTPVSMVGHTPPVVGVPCIAPVYTPPEHRRRGYAAAATAAVCTRLLAGGAHAVVLFADRFNRTATGVYERIGFRPVGDWDEWGLEY